MGYEDEEEDFGHELPCHHTFDEEDPLYKEHEHGFEREQDYGFHSEFYPYERHDRYGIDDEGEHDYDHDRKVDLDIEHGEHYVNSDSEEMHTTPMFLAHAA